MDTFRCRKISKFTPDGGVAVVDRAIQLVGDDHAALVAISMAARRRLEECGTFATSR